ncbi:hypothetical protein A3194_19150 [Candidatus Thiodiazotropha endoloripes]|uniref:hypothetical protein n=1 Tax=Candidatus Thiodiazotropha endoloripes TaxID=1818881 RepID=UPI00083D5EB7|nr:hypothetical protein [Candidatus Thiodiazotropha endoloripes]ODB82374.1 hypothetical protein A3194_19150 [Candidatus Thiodiazotropha endoloripes]
MTDNLNKESKDIVEINYEIERINEKVQSIERIASTVESLADSGLKSWDKYLQQKDEREKRESIVKQQIHEKEIESEDKKHKRSIYLLSGLLAVVFILLITALIVEQYDLVKVILNSTLAVAGGAGITAMFKKGKNS